MLCLLQWTDDLLFETVFAAKASKEKCLVMVKEEVERPGPLQSTCVISVTTGQALSLFSCQPSPFRAETLESLLDHAEVHTVSPLEAASDNLQEWSATSLHQNPHPTSESSGTPLTAVYKDATRIRTGTCEIEKIATREEVCRRSGLRAKRGRQMLEQSAWLHIYGRLHVTSAAPGAGLPFPRDNVRRVPRSGPADGHI
ncbi:uncharacterized protein LOC144159162 isoform X3 [Haemaphysalis longicornis]